VVKTFDPITHVYLFSGDKTHIEATARLLSETTLMVVCVCTHADSLQAVGMLNPRDGPVYELRGCQMPSNKAYTGYGIPITAARLRRIRKNIHHIDQGECGDAKGWWNSAREAGDDGWFFFILFMILK